MEFIAPDMELRQGNPIELSRQVTLLHFPSLLPTANPRWISIDIKSFRESVLDMSGSIKLIVSLIHEDRSGRNSFHKEIYLGGKLPLPQVLRFAFHTVGTAF